MKTLMGLAGLTMAGFMLLSCNTEVKEANYQIIPLPQEISVMDQAAPFILSNGTKIMYPEGNEKLRTVLLDVLDTPVSPELLPPEDGVISQKTEDLVGPYQLHDFYLYYVLRFGYHPERIYYLACYAFQGQYDKETILKWLKTFYRRFFSQQFKRSCLPDGPKVGSVAVSPRGDLRMPSDACSRVWMEELEAIR